MRGKLCDKVQLASEIQLNRAAVRGKLYDKELFGSELLLKRPAVRGKLYEKELLVKHFQYCYQCLYYISFSKVILRLLIFYWLALLCSNNKLRFTICRLLPHLMFNNYASTEMHCKIVNYLLNTYNKLSFLYFVLYLLTRFNFNHVQPIS